MWKNQSLIELRELSAHIRFSFRSKLIWLRSKKYFLWKHVALFAVAYQGPDSDMLGEHGIIWSPIQKNKLKKVLHSLFTILSSRSNRPQKITAPLGIYIKKIYFGKKGEVKIYVSRQTPNKPREINPKRIYISWNLVQRHVGTSIAQWRINFNLSQFPENLIVTAKKDMAMEKRFWHVIKAKEWATAWGRNSDENIGKENHEMKRERSREENNWNPPSIIVKNHAHGRIFLDGDARSNK